MKRTFSIPLLASGLLLVLGLSNCKKEQNAAPQNFSSSEQSANGNFATLSSAKEDRIDAILKDLSSSSYSLSFDQPITAAGIARTQYGADNYLLYLDPQDLICPDLFRRYQKKIPVIKIPTRCTITCPDMTIDPRVALKLQDFLINASPAQFRGLQGIKAYSGETVLTTPAFKKQYASLSSDKIDDLLKSQNPENFILLNDPANPSGLLTRNFYGYANLDELLFKPYKKSLKDILRPKYIGCILGNDVKLIREKLATINPALSKKLIVNAIPGTLNAATIGF